MTSDYADNSLQKVKSCEPLPSAAMCISFKYFVWQNKCMNYKKKIVESYCLDDNNMRAVVSLILVVMTPVIAQALFGAVRSFRTYALLGGINEGVFIAMGCPTK